MTALSGCAKGAEETDVTGEERAPLSVETPAYLPRALIDRNGYGTGAEKIVFFLCEDAGDSFEVRSEADGATVYTGNIRHADSGMYYGQFSSFQTEGTYYIYTDVTGASYPFRIGADVATNEAHRALRSLYAHRCGMMRDGAGGVAQQACHGERATIASDPTAVTDVSGGWHTDGAGNRDVVASCHALRDLLLSYEISPEAHDDAASLPYSGNGVPDVLDEALFEITWLLKMQSDDGSVSAGVEVQEDGSLTLLASSAAATAAFTDVCARFSYLYEPFDAGAGASVFSSAVDAWNAYGRMATPRLEPAAFAAAAELYRITGDRRYETVLSAFFNREDFSDLLENNTEIFFGSATYLVTTQPVNVTVRQTIRNTLTTHAERMANRAQDAAYLVTDAQPEEILDDMRRLAYANHMAYRYSYVTVMENHLHFLGGRNEERINYMQEPDDAAFGYEGAGAPVLYPESCASVLLIMYAVL